MKLAVVSFAVCSLAAGLRAESLTQGERDRALSELYASRKKFLDSVAGLSPAQWKFKPDDNVWSIAECAEHIALSEDLIFALITKVTQGPADPSKRAAIKVTDEQVLKGVNDRSQKFKAPEGEVTMQANHHLVNPVFIGETQANGQFKIIKSLGPVAGEPFSEKFLGKD